MCEYVVNVRNAYVFNIMQSHLFSEHNIKNERNLSNAVSKTLKAKTCTQSRVQKQYCHISAFHNKQVITCSRNTETETINYNKLMYTSL